MKIGIYGGTFDPIHHGHLILARDAVESLGLERVIFVPNVISPHKPSSVPTPAEVRHEMVRAATAPEPDFAVDEAELQRLGPSYTIDTVLELKEKHPDAELFYLIGHDNVPELRTWRRIEDLALLVRFVVLNRADETTVHPYLTLKRRVDLSATEIRARRRRGQSIRYFVPSSVLAIIEQYNLYMDPTL